MTLVSIITPSFNQAAYLEETMRSVLDQEDARLEYIVVDGGSEDGSLDIIRKHADRLAYWMSEKDAGQAEAINKGMARARGEIVAWLNSDDYYLPGVIEQARKAFELHPEALLIYGDMRAVDEDGRVSNEFKYPQLRLEDLLCFQIIGQPSVFMRRAAFQKVGGLDPTFHYLLDHHLWIRIAQLGPIVHVDQTWSVARYHAAAKNRARAREFGREAFRILDQAANVPALAPVLTRLFRRAHASAHRVDARYLLDGGKPARAIAAWTRAFMLHPPTALARLNILGSALINLLGLGALRAFLLRRRTARYSSSE